MPKQKNEKSPGYFEGVRTEIVAFLPGTYRKVLEIGCGNGNFRNNITMPCEYWGIEPATIPAEKSAQRMDKVLTGTFDIVFDQLPKEFFDLIICNDVIEHMPDHDLFLQKVKTCIAPGGCIVGSIPNVRFYKNLREVLFQRDWRYQDDGILDRTHLRFFTQKSLLRTFAENGYHVEAFSGINDFIPAHFNSLGNIRRWLMMAILVSLTAGAFNDIRYLQFGFRVVPA